MKATKVVMIAAIMIVAMLSQTAEATSNPKHGERPIYLTIEQAMTDAGIVQAMYQQLNRNIIESRDKEGVYTAMIIYVGVRIHITGTFSQWHQFFMMKKRVHDNNERRLS